ncbi:MAG: hypothetical protein IJ202_11725 [Bacteroidales bacterium]|nr:hypothetical protein [Bacteroidales bacterium]
MVEVKGKFLGIGSKLLVTAFAVTLLACFPSGAQSAADRLSKSRGGASSSDTPADTSSVRTAPVDPSSVYILGGQIQMEGSFLRQETKRDSVLIGDQLWYGVLLKDVAEGTLFAMPEVKQGKLLENVEMVSPWVADTVAVTKIKKTKLRTYDIEFKALITSFEEGEYELPPIPVQRMMPAGQVDTLVFNPQNLSVRTIPIDEETFEPHDIKGQIRYPLTFAELLPWIAGIWLLALIVIVAVCLWMMKKEKGEEKEVAVEAPHIRALRKLDALRGNKYWAPEKQKYFYSEVTDAVREYMVARYDIPAMEMTTAEIFSAVRGKDIPSDMAKDLKDLFERSDFVKFAKYTATDEDNASAVPLAVKFVMETYGAILEKEKEEEKNASEEKSAPGTVPPREDDSAYMPK